MTRDSMQRAGLRGVAVVIALAALVDPAITRDRRTKPVVIVSAMDSARDARLADAVTNALRGRFSVARSPVAGASGAVIVGDGPPISGDEFPSPAFVVVADSGEPTVSIDRLDVPQATTLDERVPVLATVNVRGAAGRPLDVTLRVAGAAMDRVTRRVDHDSTFSISMGFVPSSLGPAGVRVSASVDGAQSTTVADATLDVVSRRRTILFFDPRPSWTSTFVRRALERDPQFAVTSRTVTARNVSTNAGRPPATLDDPSTLSEFDVLVIGAPDALSARNVGGLEAFMRRRGGSVVFLLDDSTQGPYERLTRATAWSSSRGVPATFALSRGDSLTLRAAVTVAPARLPAAATVIAGDTKPIVWETPVGAGRLIVSGALDAWRFRDPASSTFDRFWRTVIADAAASAPPPLLVETAPAIAKPGETVEVYATIRDVALDPDAASGAGAIRPSISATLEPGTRVRMWPEGNVGRFTGTMRAPRRPGVYRVTVASGGHTADIPLIVSADVRMATPSSPTLSSAWATSRGGRLFQARDIGRLPAALDAAIRPRSDRTVWHPFRSAWWILPFVLALSAEWWLRRRQGLR